MCVKERERKSGGGGLEREREEERESERERKGCLPPAATRVSTALASPLLAAYDRAVQPVFPHI